VIVENFRSFYGEQEIEFATDREKNTTLIYAMNGVGKTNLLNSVLWCLHGEFSPSFKNREDILNWEAKRRGRKSYHVTLTFDENDSEFIVKRSGGDINSFKVFENREGNLVEIRQDPRLFINSIIPRDMAGYFISDGEGSDLVVDSDGMISVRRSIRDILGFNVAEKTSEDLGKIRAEIRAELKKVDKDKELSDIESKVQLHDESILRNRSSLEDNKSSLEKYQLQREQVDKKLGGSSSAIVKQLQTERARMEKERLALTKELRFEEGKKINLIREYSWVAFAHRLMDEGLEFIDESELKGRIPAPYNIQLVQDILSQSECICGASISPGSEAYERIEKLLGKAADPGLLNRLQRARSSLTAVKTLSGQGRGRLEENFKRCSNIRRRVNELDISIGDYSQRIEKIDDETINALEKNRKLLDGKIYETARTIGRLEEKLKKDALSKKEYQEKANRIVGLSSRAKIIKHKLDIIDQIDRVILDALEDAEQSIHAVLKSKIDDFLDKYLRQDYQVKMTHDFKIGLVDRNGLFVPPSGGQGAILSFIYISSLISIARERRDLKSSILTPGAIAPLIFDAPFSKLDSKYAPNIAKELPKLVDQLIILTYQDNGKQVDSTLKKEGKLGKVYYFTEETAADQGQKLNQELVIDGDLVPVTVYGAAMDKIVIREAKIYD
jgi:DNA sulfur modification protein DndD